MKQRLESLNASRDFFFNPDNYGPFTDTLDCIDPRNAIGQMAITKQGAGGATGEGDVAAMAYSAYEQDFVPLEVGLQRAKVIRSMTLFMSHHDCLYERSRKIIFGEIANPGDRTKIGMKYFAKRLDLRDELDIYRDEIAEAAAMQKKHLEESPADESILEIVDNLEPDHDNIQHMEGEGFGFVYVTNFHRHFGLNRANKLLYGEKAPIIRGYHSSVGALVGDIRDTTIDRNPKIDARLKGLLAIGEIAKEAATRTIIADSKEEEYKVPMTFFEVRETARGTQVIEHELD